MKVYSARQVANQLIVLATGSRNPLEPMKLQKLVYIAVGRSLADSGFSIVRERFKAWVWGPVIPSLYQDVKHWGREFIRHPIFSMDAGGEWTPRIDPEDQEAAGLLQAVWDRQSATPYSNNQAAPSPVEPKSRALTQSAKTSAF